MQIVIDKIRKTEKGSVVFNLGIQEGEITVYVPCCRLFRGELHFPAWRAGTKWVPSLYIGTWSELRKAIYETLVGEMKRQNVTVEEILPWEFATEEMTLPRVKMAYHFPGLVVPEQEA